MAFVSRLTLRFVPRTSRTGTTYFKLFLDFYTLSVGFCADFSFISVMNISACLRGGGGLLNVGKKISHKIYESQVLDFFQTETHVRVLQFSENRITTRTKQSTYFSCRVIVVDGETTTFYGLRLPTKITGIVLINKDGVIHRNGQLVVVHQPLGASFFLGCHTWCTSDVHFIRSLTNSL